MDETLVPIKIEKKDEGIYINGELKLIKDFALYMIMYKDSLENKQEAQKVWDKKNGIQILIDYFRKENENE